MSGLTPSPADGKKRAAYTLLELMLALSLLGALMTIAWSLMGTFRDAEQRGWKLAHRTQTIRAARAWLQSDVQHLLRDEATPLNSTSTKSRLTGNSLGFTASVGPSLDPLPFFEQLMSASQVSEAVVKNEPVASLYGDTDAFAAEAMQSMWAPESMEVEYELAPTASASESAASASLLTADLTEVQFSLTRREKLAANATAASGNGRVAGLSAAGGTQASASLADRVLTAQDLYRQTDETARASGAVTRESRLDGLTNVQFKYFDGLSWKSEWNSESGGGLPKAIALGFDFPARADMRPVQRQPPTSDVNGIGVTDPSDSQLSFADKALAAEPTAEVSSQGDVGLMQTGANEIQIVIYIGGPSFRVNQRTTGLQTRMSVRGSR